MFLTVQDYPNAKLVCEVNGVATTTAVTITASELTTDESGATTTLTYDVELQSMERNSPTAFNVFAPERPEAVDDEELVCDDGVGVSLFFDNTACPSPMSPSPNIRAQILAQPIPELDGKCFPEFDFYNEALNCAPGFTLEGGTTSTRGVSIEIPYCEASD